MTQSETVPLFSARLSPHRSLSRKNFNLLLLILGVISFAVSLPFLLLGAWPVAGFMGLDVALIYLAFRANFRAARACEIVSLTHYELTLAKVSARGRRRDWRFHPAWVRLERDEHGEFGTQSLALVSRGRKVEVAGFLGPDQKAEFADDFSRAMAIARQGPRFSGGAG